jgi:DNA-binding NarL/FixJ family response regulator
VKIPRASTWKSGDRRPTVVLADDHARVLEAASAFLAENFEVVAAVTDGRQAVDAARRLDPDAVVLDITMPGLDGYQTARELNRGGSRAKVLFLSMHDEDDYVVEAVRSGGQGYVLKTRMHSDLPSAVDHVLGGQLFMPSMVSAEAVAQLAGQGGHVVQFRPGEGAALDEGSELIAAALQRGDSAAVVGTEETRASIERRLNAVGCDLADAAARGRYVASDAADSLSQVMREGRIDADRLAAMVDDLDRARRSAGGEASRLVILGEMSSLLCRGGNPDTAVQLERLWTDSTRGLPFLTVCGYSMECISAAGQPGLFQRLRAEHWAVCHAHGA